MTRTRYPRPARRGFTLVELLVAMALVVLILTILAVAFGAATDTFSRLRSMGDMAERLRTANDKLRADLQGEHFDTGDSPAPLRLSDIRYNLLTSGGQQVTPPKAGYFRIENGLTAATGMIYEGQDPDNLMSSRATHHALEFTLRRRGQSADDLFTVSSANLAPHSSTDTAVNALAPNQFVSNWARVRWHLSAAPTDNPNGVPTYTLYRSVRLLVPSSASGVALTPAERELVSSRTAAPFTGHTVQQIADPTVRATAPILPYTAANTHFGDDIVLTHVTSFEVKPVWEAPSGGTPRGPRFATVGGVPNAAPLNTLPASSLGAVVPDGSVGATIPNSEYPHDELPAIPATENTDPTYAGRRIFDTWSPLEVVSIGPPAPPGGSWNIPGSNYSVPLRIRVTALQVKIRVYEPKNLLSRQVTLIVPQ